MNKAIDLILTNMWSILLQDNIMALLYINYDCDEWCTDLLQYFFLTIFKHVNDASYAHLLPLVSSVLSTVLPIAPEESVDWETFHRQKQVYRDIATTFQKDIPKSIQDYNAFAHVTETTAQTVAQMFVEVPHLNKLKMMQYFLEDSPFNRDVFREYLTLLEYPELDLEVAFVRMVQTVCLPQDKALSRQLFEAFGELYVEQHEGCTETPQGIADCFIAILSIARTNQVPRVLALSLPEFLEQMKATGCKPEDLTAIYRFVESNVLAIPNALPTVVPTSHLAQDFVSREMNCRDYVQPDPAVYVKFFTIFANLLLSALAKSSRCSLIEEEAYTALIDAAERLHETQVINNVIHQLITLTGVLHAKQLPVDPHRVRAICLAVAFIRRALVQLDDYPTVFRFLGVLERFRVAQVRQPCNLPVQHFIVDTPQQPGWFSFFAQDASQQETTRAFIRKKALVDHVFDPLLATDPVPVLDRLLALVAATSAEEHLQLLAVLQLLLSTLEQQLPQLFPRLVAAGIERVSPHFFEYVVALAAYLLERNSPLVRTLLEIVTALPDAAAAAALLKTVVYAVGAADTKENVAEVLAFVSRRVAATGSFEHDWVDLCRLSTVDVAATLRALRDLSVTPTTALGVAQFACAVERAVQDRGVDGDVLQALADLLASLVATDPSVVACARKKVEELAKFPDVATQHPAPWNELTRLGAAQPATAAPPTAEQTQAADVAVVPPSGAVAEAPSHQPSEASLATTGTEGVEPSGEEPHDDADHHATDETTPAEAAATDAVAEQPAEQPETPAEPTPAASDADVPPEPSPESTPSSGDNHPPSTEAPHPDTSREPDTPVE